MKRREYVLVLVAGAIIVLALAERLVLSPLRGAWQGLAARVSARRAALVSARELIKRADALQARYRSSAATVEGDPDTRQITFLVFLQSAAGRAGVKVASEKPTLLWRAQGGRGAAAGVQSVRFGECTVSLAFTSSLEALVHFLTELATGEEAVRVRSLRVTTQDPGGRSLEVTLRLSTVVLPAEARRLASPGAGGSLAAGQAPGGWTGALALLGSSGAEWWGGAGLRQSRPPVSGHPALGVSKVGAAAAEGIERGAGGGGHVGEQAEAQP